MEMGKTRKVKKPRVAKTRNHFTMTESQFWGFIRASLRNRSRWWKPILATKNSSKRKSQSTNKRLKWEYICQSCKGWFPEKEISVDHIKPVGTLKCAADLPEFVENLFCEVQNLQTLCATCHTDKTKKDKDERTK